MTFNVFTAEGIRWTGKEAREPGISIGSVITRGLKPSVGRPVEIKLDRHDLSLLLAHIAELYPEVIRAAAEEIGSYQPVPEGHYDRDRSGRDKRVREAIMNALEGGK